MTRKSKTAPATASATTKSTGSTRIRKVKEIEVKAKAVKLSINEVMPTKLRLKCKNAKQKEFLNLIEAKEIVIACGPAGVGKSYVAIAKAIELLQSDSNYHTLVIVKPAVESEENHGFLPGSLKDKMEPHVASSIDIVDKLVGESTRINLEDGRILKIEPLGFIRGKTIDNSIVIIEEAQNMSPSQMKTLLTRIGDHTKYIISGDLDQSDKYSDVSKSGLYDAIYRHQNVEEIGFFEFDENDIVRNPLITKILKNYKKVEVRKPKTKEEEKPLIDPVTGQIDLKYPIENIKQDIFIANYGDGNGNVKERILDIEPIVVKKGFFKRNFKW